MYYAKFVSKYYIILYRLKTPCTLWNYFSFLVRVHIYVLQDKLISNFFFLQQTLFIPYCLKWKERTCWIEIGFLKGSWEAFLDYYYIEAILLLRMHFPQNWFSATYYDVVALYTAIFCSMGVLDPFSTPHQTMIWSLNFNFKSLFWLQTMVSYTVSNKPLLN